MKSAKLLSAITIAVILMQVFAFAALNLAKADTTTTTSTATPQGNGFLGYFQDFNHGIQGFCNWWTHHHPGSGDHGHRHTPHLTVTPQTATIAAGQTETYKATIHFQNGKSFDVSTDTHTVWSINSGAGTYTWTGHSVQVTAAGTWTITANFAGISASASLTVTHAGTDKLAKLTASVNPSTVEAPNTAVGTATATDIYGNSWDVSAQATWSIPAGGDGGSWSGNVYTSHTAGTYTVQAAYGGKTATATLTVTHSTNPSNLVSLSISPATATIAAGTTQAYTATATDTFGNIWDATSAVSASNGWSINATAGGSWSGAIYTSEKAGDWNVTAAYLSKTATADLGVTAAADQLDHIVISPKTATVGAGVSQPYTATAYDVFGNSWVVSAVYSCTNSSVIITGNSAYSDATGTFTITGTYSGKSDEATLIVNGHLSTPTSITVAPKTVSIPAGTTQAFTATATDGTNTWDVTDSVVWSIDAGAAGSWSQGTYTSANAGTWTVKATLDTLSDTATLTVTANSALLQHITISPKTATVTAGTAQTYTATAYDQFGNSLGDVTSSTAFSAPSASVNGNSVTEANAGTYTVTATYQTLTDTATLTVTASSQNNPTGTYTVTFTESGLPSGTSWSITFQGQPYSSTSTTLSINNLSAQSYSWSTSGIQNGETRYAPAKTSGSLSVPSQQSVSIQYTTQYEVTYTASGNVLSVTVPANEWVDSGGKPTGTFPAQVTNTAQDTRSSFISDNRTDTVTQPTTILGGYATQYAIVFEASGMQSDAEGTVLTAQGSTQDYNQLSAKTWVDTGKQLTFAFEASVKTTSSTKTYALTSVNATSPITIIEPFTVKAAYKAQYSSNLYMVLEIALVIFAIILILALLLQYRRNKANKAKSINQTR